MAALTAFATVDDLDALLDVDVTDLDRAEALIAAASTLVRAETGSAWVDADGNLEWAATTDEKLNLVGDALTSVALAAAGRAYLNPKGSVSEGTGPFTIQRGQEAANGVYLTDSERQTIAAAVALQRGSTSPGLWTLGTTRNDLPCSSDIGTVGPDGNYYLETTPGGGQVLWADAGQFG